MANRTRNRNLVLDLEDAAHAVRAMATAAMVLQERAEDTSDETDRRECRAALVWLLSDLKARSYGWGETIDVAAAFIDHGPAH